MTTIMVRTPDLLTGYLTRIGWGKLLTCEEELSLSRAVKVGDSKARARLAEKNLRLVVSRSLDKARAPAGEGAVRPGQVLRPRQSGLGHAHRSLQGVGFVQGPGPRPAAEH